MKKPAQEPQPTQGNTALHRSATFSMESFLDDEHADLQKHLGSEAVPGANFAELFRLNPEGALSLYAGERLKQLAGLRILWGAVKSSGGKITFPFDPQSKAAANWKLIITTTTSQNPNGTKSLTIEAV